MSAHISWESERAYNPPIPAIFMGGEAAAQMNN
jgi:hypothetical protein